MVCIVKPVSKSVPPRRPSTTSFPISRAWESGALRTSAASGKAAAAFVTHPDAGPYVRWTYRLEPSGTGTRGTEIRDVEQLSPGRRNQTQEQLDERSRYTEGMLATTLAALKATAEG